MEESEIKANFYDAMKDRKIGKKAGLTKQQVYNYRHRDEPGIGIMLEVLWKLDKLEMKIE